MEPKIEINKPEWIENSNTLECYSCTSQFTLIKRRHHCRYCGQIFCNTCSNNYCVLPLEMGYSGAQRLCNACFTQFEQKRQFYDNDAIIAQLQLRGSSISYTYQKALPNIGHTKHGLRKSYFMCNDEGGVEVILAIVTPSPSTMPWSLKVEKINTKCIKTMNNLKHNNIYPIVNMEFGGLNDKVFIFRNYTSKGSLKDMIFKSKPTSPYDSKYILNTKKSFSSGVPLKSVNKYARQILEGLSYLKQKGITFIHLHTGNIMVGANDTMMLSDIENTFLGMKPLYHDYIVGKENPEVICFSHVFFEMVIGCALNNQPASNFQSVIPPETADIFKFLFPEGKSAPTLEETIKHPFFSANLQLNQIVTGDGGKLKKSELQFIKDYENKYELTTTISPRGPPTPLKKQISSTSMVNSSDITGNTSSTIGNSSTTPITPPAPTSTNVGKTTNVATNPLMVSVQEKMQAMKLQKSSTNLTSNNPPPPSVSSAPPPPPPPPKLSTQVPPPQNGRSALLESIRKNNIQNLKKVSTNTNTNTKPKVQAKKK